MLSIITGWFLKEGAALLLGALAKIAVDAWGSYQANKAQRDLGAAEAKIETQNETIDAQQRELDAQANAPKTVDEAIARLEDEEGAA